MGAGAHWHRSRRDLVHPRDRAEVGCFHGYGDSRSHGAFTRGLFAASVRYAGPASEAETKLNTLTLRCSPGNDLLLQVDVEARPGESVFVQFIGPVENRSYFTIAERACERISAPGPHLLRFSIPMAAPEGTNQMTGLSFVSVDSSPAEFDASELYQVQLQVAHVSSVAKPPMLRLTRPSS